MLPFNPQSVWKMRQRYPKALEKIWVAEEGMIDRPGNSPENVFDFGGEHGLRLIISRDILKENDKPKLHVSASYFHSSPSSLEEALEMIFNAFRLLDRRSAEWKFVGLSEKGIPHWVLEEVN